MLLSTADRLMAEEDTPTAPGWRAFVATTLERRAEYESAEAGLVVEAEHYLHGYTGGR